MSRGTHGEKIVAVLDSNKLPDADKGRITSAIQRYDEWVAGLEATTADTLDELIDSLVAKLNEYKYYIDVDLIFDSTEDFLYRQKGQLLAPGAHSHFESGKFSQFRSEPRANPAQ